MRPFPVAGSLADLFGAFFGDDLFGTGGRGGRARGADIVAQVEIELTEAATGTAREVPCRRRPHRAVAPFKAAGGLSRKAKVAA